MELGVWVISGVVYAPRQAQHQTGGHLGLASLPACLSGPCEGHLSQVHTHLWPVVPDGVLLVSGSLPTVAAHLVLPGPRLGFSGLLFTGTLLIRMFLSQNTEHRHSPSPLCHLLTHV